MMPYFDSGRRRDTHGPMKPHWFFILLSVSAAPRYGTAIQDDVP